jgi:hypothetical protein
VQCIAIAVHIAYKGAQTAFEVEAHFTRHFGTLVANRDENATSHKGQLPKTVDERFEPVVNVFLVEDGAIKEEMRARAGVIPIFKVPNALYRRDGQTAFVTLLPDAAITTNGNNHPL